MATELELELFDLVQHLSKIVKDQQKIIDEQLLPGWVITGALIESLPGAAQKSLVGRLQNYAAQIPPSVPVEDAAVLRLRSTRAVQLVSDLVFGSAAETTPASRFQVIWGGKDET